MTFHELANKIAGEIPEGWNLIIDLERGAGVVVLTAPDGERVPHPDQDYRDLEEEVLEALAYAIEQQGSCRIFAAEISFPAMLIPKHEIVSMCKHILAHPEQYSRYEAGTDAAYYQFAKYLWVRMPDGTDRRFSDVVKGEL